MCGRFEINANKKEFVEIFDIDDSQIPVFEPKTNIPPGAHIPFIYQLANTRQLSSALWGLVPCGMLYGVLSMALFSGSGKNGGLLMLTFGLGTLPNLMLLGVAGDALKRVTGHWWVRQLVGATIVGFGLLGLLRIDAVIDTVNGVPVLRELCRVIN